MIRLVSFRPHSKHHKRAREFLAKRDGLTGLFVEDHLVTAITNECAFAEWYEAPMQVARYELRGPNRQVTERPTIVEVVEQVVSQVRGLLPDTIELVATLVKWEPGKSARSLIE